MNFIERALKWCMNVKCLNVRWYFYRCLFMHKLTFGFWFAHKHVICKKEKCQYAQLSHSLCRQINTFNEQANRINKKKIWIECVHINFRYVCVAISRIYQRNFHKNHAMQTFVVGNLTRIFDFDWLLLVKEFPFNAIRSLNWSTITKRLFAFASMIARPKQYYYKMILCKNEPNSPCSN